MDWTLATIALALLAFAAVSGRVDGTPLTPAIVFVALGLLVGPEALGLLEPSSQGERVKLLAEATLTVVLFADASRIDLRALRREIGIPGAASRDRAAADARRRPRRRPSRSSPTSPGPRRCSWRSSSRRPTRRSDRPSSRFRGFPPGSVRGSTSRAGSTTGSACRSSSSRSPLPRRRRARSATAPPSARRRADRLRASSGASSRRRGRGLVRARRPPTVDAAWLQIGPARRAPRSRTASRPDRRLGVHRRVRRADGVRRAAPRTGGGGAQMLEEGGAALGAVTFVVFGAVLLGPALGDVTAAIVVYAVLSLTLVRMLPVALALLGTGARRPTVGFLGWFGPRGLASIVFAILLEEESDLPNEETILLTVFSPSGSPCSRTGSPPLRSRALRPLVRGESRGRRRSRSPSSSRDPLAELPRRRPSDGRARSRRAARRPLLAARARVAPARRSTRST